MSSLCQICLKNPATAHLKELDSDGNLQELHICNSCCTKFNLDLALDPKPIQEIISITAAGSSNEDDVEADDLDIVAISSEEGDDEIICPHCETSFEQFSKNNRFGCANCYDAFSERLDGLLEELHGEAQHCGRSPQQECQHNQVLAKRISLEKRLKDVIAEERFEEAAQIRDQLKELDA